MYLDPPYLPLGGHSDFHRYTKEFFTEKDHVRLAEEFGKLAARGIKALMSNSATERIEELYADYSRIRVLAARQINCRAEGRKKIPELLVANYPLESTGVVS